MCIDILNEQLLILLKGSLPEKLMCKIIGHAPQCFAIGLNLCAMYSFLNRVLAQLQCLGEIL